MANISSNSLPIYADYIKVIADQDIITKYVAPFVTLFITILLLIFRSIKNPSVLSQHKKQNNNKPIKPGFLFSFKLPFIDTLYFVYKARRDGTRYFDELAKKYGNLFEIPFLPVNFMVVADPEIIQKILSSTDPHHLNRPKLYRSIFEIFQDGLVTSDYDMWSMQRKMLSRCFTYKSLQNYLVFMNTHSRQLTSRLFDECSKNDTVEGLRLSQLLYCYAFKTISQILMGTDCLSPEESESVSNKANRLKDLIVERLMNPLSYKHYFWMHPKKREYDYLLKFITNFIVDMKGMYKKKAVERNEWGKTNQSQAILDDNDDDSVGVHPFRCVIEEMLSCGADDKEICDQVATLWGTGHETTVVAIRILLLHLALNPDHQIKCREEVDLFYSQQISDEANLTMDDLQNLKYLERCILESGRLTSTVPIFLRRLDAPLKIDDNLEFPANTNFAICPWLLHRDPNVFSDPLKFDPDRFLAENVKKRHSYSYIPFSLGPKLCIGYKLALMQIKITMTQILRNFEIYSDEKLEDVKFLLGLTSVPEKDFKIILKRRAW